MNDQIIGLLKASDLLAQADEVLAAIPAAPAGHASAEFFETKRANLRLALAGLVKGVANVRVALGPMIYGEGTRVDERTGLTLRIGSPADLATNGGDGWAG